MNKLLTMNFLEHLFENLHIVLPSIPYAFRSKSNPKPTL